jgi:hypothetical protein
VSIVYPLLAAGASILPQVIANTDASLGGGNNLPITATVASGTNDPNPANDSRTEFFLLMGTLAFTVNPKDDPIDFGQVQTGKSVAMNLVIKPGSQPVDITSLNLTPGTGTPARVFTAPGTNTPISLGKAQLNVSLVFQPFTSGPKNASLDIIAAGIGQTISRSLMGQGMAPISGTLILAHVADGNNFTTTVLLTNPDTAAAAYSLTIHDESGNPLSFTLANGSGPLNGSVPPGGSATIRTTGQGTQTVSGWAELTAPAQVGVSVIYGLKESNKVQEGTTVASAQGSHHFFVPFDNTNNAVTGLALTNPGAVAANVTVAFRYDSGGTDTVTYPQVAARTHQAYSLFDRFPSTKGRSGVAEFTSDVDLFAVAFRVNSTGAFTAFAISPGQP